MVIEMSYPTLVLKRQRKRTGFPLIDLVLDFVDWVVENPEKAIALGLIVTFTGVGIASAGATLLERRRRTLEQYR
jgi:hypothetical protein